MAAKIRRCSATWASLNGFSMTEVMVAGSLTAGLAVSSATMTLSRYTSMQGMSLRDASHARIAEDLQNLRQLSWRFGCEDGDLTDGSNVSSACTGRPQDADKPVRYKSSRSPGGTPTPIAAYQQACQTDTMAQLMQSKDSRFDSGTQTLALVSTDPNAIDRNAALASANLTIQRTISLDSADKNKLHITYTTPPGAAVKVKMHSTLVPQAVGWCP